MADVSQVPPSEIPLDPTPVPGKKRRWLRWLGVFVILFVLFVALLPTLLSLSPARSIIVGQLQSVVPNGKLTIDDWSLGWFSPISVSGVKLYDDKGDLVVETNAFKTDLTIVKAIRQHFDLGDTLIDANAAHVVVYPDGSSNLQKIFASSKAKKAEEPKKPTEPKEVKPTQLPDVKGNITLKLKGNVQVLDAADKPVTTLALHEGSGGTIKIDDINTGIAPDLKFIYDTGDATKPSEIAINGSVEAVKNNLLVDVKDMGAKVELSLKDVDLAVAKPFMAMAGQPQTQVAGIAGGAIAGELKAGQEGSIDGELSVANLKLQMPQLADVYQAAIVRMPVKVSRVVAAGVSRLQVETSLILPEATVQLNGDLPEAAIDELKKKAIPSQAGTATVTLTADPKKLAAALPNTLHLQKGMTIDGGALSAVVASAIDPARKSIISHVKTDLSINGTQNGKAQSIPPINLTADASLSNLDDPMAGLHDVVLSLSSSFANLKLGGPTVATLQGNGDADLDKLSSEVSQFVNLGETKLAGQAKFSLATKQQESSPNAIHADVNADVSQLDVTLPQKSPIAMAIAQLKMAADVRIDPATNGLKSIETTTVSLLAGDTADKPLLDLHTQIDGYDIAVKTAKSVSIDKCTISSLKDAQTRLIDPFSSALKDQHIRLTDGALYLVLKAANVDIKSTGADVQQCEGSLPSLRVERDGRQILTDTIRFAAIGKAATADGVTSINLSKLSLDSAVAKVTGSGIVAQLPDGKTVSTQLVKQATLVIGVSDLAKTQALLTTVSPGTKLPANFGGGVAINVGIEKGVATLQIDGSRLSATNAEGKTFAFSKSNPISVKAVVSIPDTTPITNVTVSQLEADVDVAQVKTTGPLTVTNLNTKPQANGQLSVTASLDRLSSLLQVIQSAVQPMPYRGTLNLHETVATANDVITLKGDGTISQFQIAGADGKVQFSEPKLALANDVSVDPGKEIATLKSLSLDMTSSKAATVNVTGGVSQWSTQRALDAIVLKLDADGAKAWPLVYAMMTPEQQAKYQDTTVKGPVTANFTLGGAYPVAKTWNESFKSMTGKGSLAAESVSSMGLAIQQFALPLTIQKGQVITGDLSAPKGAGRQVKPFVVNGGKADFSNIVLNLGDPNLLLSIGRGQKLLQQVQINSVMAAQLGSLASVVFNDSKKATGLLDLTAIQCDNVRLADLMNKKANATFVYSIKDLTLDGPVPSTLASLLDLGDQGFVGNIKDASLALKQGVAYQDMTIAVQKMVDQTNPKTGVSSKVATDQPIQFKGGVDLSTNKFKDYAMTIPNGLLLRDWRKSFPDGATVNLTGNVSDISSILGQSVGKLAVQGYGGGEIDKLLGGLGGKKKKK